MTAPKTYTITGIDCAECARTVEKGVAQLPGVQAVEVDFATAQLRLTGDLPTATLQARLQTLGYDLAAPAPRPTPRGLRGFAAYVWERPDTRLAVLGSAGIALAGALMWAGAPALVTQGLLLAALALAGYPIARSGLTALVINRDININLLMTLAAIGAVIIGEPLEAATLIVLFALAEALEGYTADRARASLRDLLDLAPPQAYRVRADQTELAPVAVMQVGDVALVPPGERIPLDGVVLTGHSEVNQAPLTGESVPVNKAPGDTVLAGSINGAGALTIQVTHRAADTTLSRIIQLVESAQSNRAPTQRFIDRFARYYTPAVVTLAGLVAVIPPVFFQQTFWDTPTEHGWLYRALALLVIACPCALVISAPVTVISALTAAARRGVLIKGGTHLEMLARVRALAFDKTGTLTRGHPEVTAVRALDCVSEAGCERCADVLALAAALEQHSTHPLAQAVVRAAQAQGVAQTYTASAVTALPGRGLQGQVNGKTATLGSHRLFDSEHPHAAQVCQQVNAVEASGHSTMLVCDGDRVRGYVALADTVRPESRAAVEALKALGAHAVMLTGDNPTVARAIAEQVGVAEVRANLLPADKLAAIEQLRGDYGRVAMVGDGINDTPALAAADVGVAVGGAASAQAIETADVVLMAEGLQQLPFALRLARFAQRLMQANIIFSLVTKLGFVALAFFGFTSLWLAVLADMGVSLLVTLNGMRALRFEKAPSATYKQTG